MVYVVNLQWCLKTDDQVSVTTVREIKILKALNHPNIVEIIDMVVERGESSEPPCSPATDV